MELELEAKSESTSIGRGGIDGVQVFSVDPAIDIPDPTVAGFHGIGRLDAITGSDWLATYIEDWDMEV